jgi:hypothetical protein
VDEELESRAGHAAALVYGLVQAYELTTVILEE